MKNSYYIFLLFLGIFFIPSSTYACSKDKHSSENAVQMSEQHTEEKDCCANGHGEDKECNGTCGHSKCSCSATCTVTSVPVYLHFKLNTTFNFSLLEKVNFYYNTPTLLEGFSSLWLIPKIG